MHLVLDLDETLIHVSMTPIKEPDFVFTIQGNKYFGKKRPSLDLFLKFVFDRFNSVSVWTAATAEYARKVLCHIMTPEQRKRLVFVKTRRDLETGVPGPYFKPLRKIFESIKAKEIGMIPQNTIMIDDRDDVLCDNPGNGIKMPPWRGLANDTYLAKLLIVLDGILQHNLGFGHFSRVIDLRTIVE